MGEARDRLIRPFDFAAAYAEMRFGNPSVYINPPPQVVQDMLGSPAMQRTATGLRFGATRVIGGGVVRGGLRTPRSGNGRGRNSFGRENRSVGSSRQRRGRANNSVLPSWYPRRPLQDITAVVRAIERRRDRLVENDGEHTEGQVPVDQGVIGQSFTVSGAQHEQSVPVTPHSVVRTKKCLPPSVGKVSKILRDVANQTSEGDFLTPQKRLLNSIDTVEKVVREELQRLKRTPSAKKAEREQKVRMLMSMR